MYVSTRQNASNHPRHCQCLWTAVPESRRIEQMLFAQGLRGSPKCKNECGRRNLLQCRWQRCHHLSYDSSAPDDESVACILLGQSFCNAIDEQCPTHIGKVKSIGPAWNISVYILDEQSTASVFYWYICIPTEILRRQISNCWHGARQGRPGLAGCEGWGQSRRALVVAVHGEGSDKRTCGAGPVAVAARVGNNGPNGECIDPSNPTIRIYMVRRRQMIARLPSNLPDLDSHEICK